MKELFQALEKVMEEQNKRIRFLYDRIDALQDTVDAFNNLLMDAYFKKCDSDIFSKFSERHGSKFEGISAKMKGLLGDDYDPVRATYESTKTRWNDEDWSSEKEDAAVDGILGECIQALDKLKDTLPEEQQEAIEEVKEEVKEAALVNDASNSDGESANENVSEDTDEWSEEMLEQDWNKNKSKRGY